MFHQQVMEPGKKKSLKVWGEVWVLHFLILLSFVLEVHTEIVSNKKNWTFLRNSWKYEVRDNFYKWKAYMPSTL